jgi:putative transcriptional regulator
MIDFRLEPMLARRGRTFYWLAKETGLSHASLWKLRHGHTKGVRFDTLEAICDALECAPGDLLILTRGKKKGGNKSADGR